MIKFGFHACTVRLFENQRYMSQEFDVMQLAAGVYNVL